MKRFALLCFTCVLSWGATPNKPSIPKEVFAVAQQPGAGTLNLKIGEITDKWEFGTDKGRYGVGLVFPPKSLPETLRKSSGNRAFIQLALGHLNPGEAIPEFGSFTLVVEKVPSAKPLEIVIPPMTERKDMKRNSALLVATRSNLLASESDEEKLKATYFGSTGSVLLTPKGQPEKVTLTTDSGNFAFKRQTFILEVKAGLSNPFNPAPASLEGKVGFRIFWPGSPAAEKLVAKLATESMETIPVISEEKQKLREISGK